jgi:hypothetical protein
LGVIIVRFFWEHEIFQRTNLLLKGLKEREKCIFMVCGRGRCQKGRWIWAEVAVKAWRDLATLEGALFMV